MGELKARTYAGIDISKEAVQFSTYDEGTEEMSEEFFPLSESDQEDYILSGLDYVKKYMECNGISWEDYSNVCFSMEDTSPQAREHLKEILDDDYKNRFEVHIINRFRAFVEYVFHQERVVWDRNTMLLEYRDNILRYILVEQIYRSKQKAYRAVIQEIDLEPYGIVEGSDMLDQNFSKMMKQFLIKNPTHIIFLTGKGFEGNWMKKTLTYLCSGRRVFLGQNLYANGACLLGVQPIPFMNEGMILMQGPDMVYHTIGIVTYENRRPKYQPITSIGREWFNTKGSVDIILDKNQKVEFFYHNTKENEIESAVCEIKDLPKRPPKTTRIRIEVSFTSCTEGIIFLTDLGFGSLYPKTEKVTVFPFKLIS